MNKIKDITLLVFAVIGFYTVINSFTVKPNTVKPNIVKSNTVNSNINQDVTVIYEGDEVKRGILLAISYDKLGGMLMFQTDKGSEEVYFSKQD